MGMGELVPAGVNLAAKETSQPRQQWEVGEGETGCCVHLLTGLSPWRQWSVVSETQGRRVVGTNLSHMAGHEEAPGFEVCGGTDVPCQGNEEQSSEVRHLAGRC